MFIYVCMCLFPKKIQKRKLTGSSAQNIFGDPRYSQVSPWVSVGFPGKKRSSGLRCRPPHACIHLEKFMYPLALVSGAPHKAYIFRFNTPTINTFPASGTHTCLILRGYPPPSSHTFLAKSEVVNPPLTFIHYQKCMIHPPAPEPVGVGDTGMQTKDFKELKSNYAANLRCKQRWVQCILWLKLPYFHLSRVGRRKSYAPGITTECLQQFMGLGKARPGNAWPYVFSHLDHHSQWIYSKLCQVPANISQWICKACKAFTCTSLQSSHVYWFIVERMGQGGGGAIQICSNCEGDRI